MLGSKTGLWIDAEFDWQIKDFPHIARQERENSSRDVMHVTPRDVETKQDTCEAVGQHLEVEVEVLPHSDFTERLQPEEFDSISSLHSFVKSEHALTESQSLHDARVLSWVDEYGICHTHLIQQKELNNWSEHLTQGLKDLFVCLRQGSDKRKHKTSQVCCILCGETRMLPSWVERECLPRMWHCGLYVYDEFESTEFNWDAQQQSIQMCISLHNMGTKQKVKERKRKRKR